MSSPLEYYANLPLSPEASEQVAPEQVAPEQVASEQGAQDTGAQAAEAEANSVQAEVTTSATAGEMAMSAMAGEEALVASVGDVHLTKADVAEAVHLAVAGAVEQAVSGAVRSAVEAAVKANVNPLAAEARFKHKYLGISPVGTAETAFANDSTVPLVEVPRIVLSESGVTTVVPPSTRETEIESAFEAEAARFEQAMELVEETAAEALLEALPETEAMFEALPETETGRAVECAEPLAERETVSETESDEFVEQAQPETELAETALEEVFEEVFEEVHEEVLEVALPAVEPLEETTVEPVAEQAVELAVERAPKGEPQAVLLEEPKPADVQPMVVQPVVAQAMAAQPVAVQPVVAQPVAVQPDQVAELEHAALVSLPATEQSGMPAVREAGLREEKSVQFVGFLVGTQMYAVPSILIKEVIRRQPTNRLPVQTRYVTGVINLRGQVMPLISLRELLLTDMPADGVCNQFSIITGQGNMLIALEVDRIRSMYVIQQEEIVWNVSGVLGLDDESVIGLFELDERLVPILSMERIAAMLLEEGLDMANLAM